jgi:uncharacterized membrane protein YkoI
MYTTIRHWYKYGNESDTMECTFKEFETIEKAIAYAHRYAKGIKFAGIQIEDEKGNTVYEITSDSESIDYRKVLSTK